MHNKNKISGFIHFYLLISFSLLHFLAQSQNSNSADTGLDSPIFYSAEDSIVMDVPNQLVWLYGNAKVNYEDINLNASIIQIDLKNNEVMATYSLDTAGNMIGKPQFSDGQEEMECQTMKYNFETEKGYITEVRTTQNDGYIHMTELKRHPNEEVHFKKGKYTSCDHENPHFHFELSKAIMVPNKRIVTGPIYMRLFNVPVPIAAPFAVLPNTDKRLHGIVLDNFDFSLANNLLGTGFLDLGYYIPINDHWETTFFLSAYTTGRFGIANRTNYYTQYKHRGDILLRFDRLKGYFFENTTQNKYSIVWNHNQEATAHPSMKFNASINFMSDNNPKQSIEIIPQDYFNSQLNSSINLTKSFKVNSFSGSWVLKSSLGQNSNTGIYTMDLPSFSLNLARFDLGVLRKEKIGKKWYENITVNYSLNSLNRIIAPDSAVNFNNFGAIGDFATNGVKQNVIVQTNLKPKSGWFVFNLNSTYNESWNFQTFEKYWNPVENKIDTTLFNDFAAHRDINFSGGLSSNVYGYYKSNGKRKTKFRHVMSPKTGFTYKPDMGNHQMIQIDTLGSQGYYSPFDVSLYREVARGESGRITFSLGNTLEMKTKDMKDSLNGTFKNIKLIDQFNIAGDYDIFKDSMKLSDITFSMVNSPIKFLQIQSGARLSPYSWNDSTFVTNSTYAWEDGRGIGRITTANIAVTSRISNTIFKKEKSNINTSVDSTKKKMKIPWDMSLTYNNNFTRSQNGIVQIDTVLIVQTLRLDGNLSLNENWRFSGDINFDLQAKKLTNYRIGIYRSLHCWEASLTYNQIGRWKDDFGQSTIPQYSILFRINVKASMFDALLPQQNLRIPTGWLD